MACVTTGPILTNTTQVTLGFPGGSDSKDSACNVGDPGLIPGLGRPPGEGNGYPLQYSCLENSMDREAWWATVHRGSKESDTTKGQMLHYTNFGQVGMRHYHLARNQSFCPNVSLDKLWTSVSELIW